MKLFHSLLLSTAALASLAVAFAHRGAETHDDQFLFRQSLHACHESNPCVLSPEVMEGPYFIPDIALRSNITEDRAGVPMQLAIQVIDAETCLPLACFVDLWTADAAGHYSGFLDSMIKISPGDGPPPGKGKHEPPHGPGGPGGPPGRGGPPRPRPTTPGPGSHIPTDNSTFLRGVVPTDHSGTATFDLVYPGWYPGRVTHLHLKVHHDRSARNTSQHTGQLFLPDELNAEVAVLPPYSNNTARRLLNKEDMLFRETGGRSLLTDIEWAPTPGGGKMIVGRAVVGVNVSAVFDERIV